MEPLQNAPSSPLLIAIKPVRVGIASDQFILADAVHSGRCETDDKGDLILAECILSVSNERTMRTFMKQRVVGESDAGRPVRGKNAAGIARVPRAAWLSIGLICGFLPMAIADAKAKSTEPVRPNIILILADDLGYGDIGAFGSKTNRTPNLDRMAREGMKMTSFYAAPVCTPSRAQILTGCYAKRVSLPVVIFPASAIGLSAEEHTVASLLKAQGYATMAIGKWHVGDQPEFLPIHRGFDHYLGLPYSNDMGPQEAVAKKAKAATNAIRPPLPLLRDDKVIETLTAKGQEKITERYTDEAVKFIREHKSDPFFLYLPHTAVHTPIHPGDQFRGKSATLYEDWVEELDWSAGRVLDTVRELGLAERTLVVFTSDNGPWLVQGKNGGVAGPLRGGKGSTWEGGVREPTIVWWPGRIPAGSTCDAVAGNYDFLPTFVKLADGTVPADRKIDGKDISALWFGTTNKSPHEAHYYFNANRLEGIRSGPWKLRIAPEKPKTGEAPQEFRPTLYNLDSDIGEQTDVATQNPEVVKHLTELVDRMDHDLGITNIGPGVRPPGRVTHPVGLYVSGQAPAAAP